LRDFNRALSYSFLLLKYRARSKSEIVSRLKKKGYAPAVRKEVLAYLEENNYINDEDFARFFIDCSVEKGWGPRRIDFNLQKLGISWQLRKQVLNRDFDYRPKIREIIRKKLSGCKREKLSLRNPKVWRKIAAHLIGRGFDYNVIYQELRNFGADNLEDV
jgi:regulatory protein